MDLYSKKNQKEKKILVIPNIQQSCQNPVPQKGENRDSPFLEGSKSPVDAAHGLVVASAVIRNGWR